ncbi:hypothetical protein [Lyngbya confervoides]|uniref:Uncharacterized protein n=1 Tax=Lyngbya confervoides BDU141951 TaxID=1574623 RepID=A0ABD4T3R7_9CYAN|nr:hypothetical protein [Lyngbya confervoides]MCM1983066.1 hypothetical protein [Lyngbya confervoides BDU141951]
MALVLKEVLFIYTLTVSLWIARVAQGWISWVLPSPGRLRCQSSWQ